MMLTIVGMAINASITEPENAVSPVDSPNIFFTSGTNVTNPMKQSTILGIAANNSTPALSTSRSHPDAISPIKIAHAIPRGTEMAVAPNVTQSDPKINGSVPNWGGSEIG